MDNLKWETSSNITLVLGVAVRMSWDVLRVVTSFSERSGRAVLNVLMRSGTILS